MFIDRPFWFALGVVACVASVDLVRLDLGSVILGD